MAATWEAGTLTVPAATGNVTVTGLSAKPQALFFFGTNWTTEDTAVTTTGTAIFRGMAAPKYDDPNTILQNAACVSPAGDQHIIENSAILCQSTAGTGANLYGATVSTFNNDGFLVNFFTAAAGGYKVVWVALSGVDDIGAYVGTGGTISLGWKAGASLLHGAWGGPTIGGSDRTQEFYGGAAYPGSDPTGWFGAGLSAFTFPTAAGPGQYNIDIYNFLPQISITQGGHFLGPFLVAANITAVPSGGGLTDFAIDFDGTNDGGMVVMWDDSSSQTGKQTLTPDNNGDTATVTTPFAPGLVLGYSVSDEPNGQNSGSTRGAVGLSVAVEGFQWSAIIDGASSFGAFQSFQRGFADGVSGTNVHAGSITLQPTGFVMETEVDTMAPQPWVWHAFGHPTRRPAWIPQIYRRVVPG